MGLLYQATKTNPLRKFRGLHPTTLGELLDKLDMLSDEGIGTHAVVVRPEVHEKSNPEDIDITGWYPGEVSYFVRYLAHLENGKTIELRESTPIYLPSYDPRNLRIADEGFMEHSKDQMIIINEKGYNSHVESKRPD
jgi:hypothetical protein